MSSREEFILEKDNFKDLEEFEKADLDDPKCVLRKRYSEILRDTKNYS